MLVTRIAVIVIAAVMGISVALPTSRAAVDVPDTSESCGSLALAMVGAAGRPGTWMPLQPQTTAPDEDGNCPDGYEAT